MFQKVFVLIGLNMVSFSNGIVFGHIASLVNALEKNEEGIQLSDGQISIIASTVIAMNIFGFGLSAIISNKFGRKWPFVIFSAAIALNWIIIYYATTMYQFMLSRIIAGIAVGALWKLNIFVTAEYTSPKSRVFNLNMVTTVSPALGSCLVHTLGIILNWRTVALICTIPAILCVILPVFWLESPHYLASVGKFEECEASFRKLHGTSSNSERELEFLIAIENTKLDTTNGIEITPTLKRLMFAFKRRYFWELLVMSVFIHLYIAAGGKLVFTSLATVMLEEITGTSDVLTYTLIVDGFIITGSIMSCVLIRNISLRALLLSTGYAASVVLVVLSACIYFNNGHSIFNWIIVGLLALYFILVNCGPYPLLEAVYSEMFPLDLKLYIFSISGVILVLALTLSMFLFTCIVNTIGYHGLLLVNAAITSMSLSYIWLKWPKTEGRTLQEIEVYFKTDNFDVEEVLNERRI